MGGQGLRFRCAFGIVFFLSTLPAIGRSADDAAAFGLTEISAFDVPAPIWYHFTSGQYVKCGAEPNERVKRCPSFASSQPLFGSLVVGAQPSQRDSGLCYPFAVDESAGTGRGYDRLYFDSNRNGDLTDDGCKAPRRDIPKMDRFESPSLKANVCFDFLRIGLTPDGPERRLEVMPRLIVYKDDPGSRYMFFITTKAHEGLIQVGNEKFMAFLGHYGDIAGWFDRPETALHILPADNPARGRPAWRGGMQLSSTHRRGGVYYRFGATPSGDQLFVRPYRGPLGTFEIVSGGRQVGDAAVAGSLGSRDTTIALSAELTVLPIQPVRSCRLPVGDYYPESLTVTYGRLDFLVLRNVHADGQPRAYARSQPQVFPITIREDKPFVLDFSGQPQVLFALPVKDHRVCLGDELTVKAVLTDPALGLMFRSITRGKQLNPKVAIKRANRKTIAEGSMPFG